MKTVRFEKDGAIGSIVLANPPFNRIDSTYAANLLDAVHQASESGIRVLVIRAEGPNFSFGGEVREWPGKDINWFRTFVAEVNQSYRAIEALRVPTLASVQGIAMGGGFELALACDLIIAAEDAVFQNVEVTTGMLPIAGGSLPILAALERCEWLYSGTGCPPWKVSSSVLCRISFRPTDLRKRQAPWRAIWRPAPLGLMALCEHY